MVKWYAFAMEPGNAFAWLNLGEMNDDGRAPHRTISMPVGWTLPRAMIQINQRLMGSHLQTSN